MSTPPKANKDLNSKSKRTLTGRIGRSRSASSLFSTQDRGIVDSESARDRIWQYNQVEQNSEAHLSLSPLPEHIAPHSSAVLAPLTAASTESYLPSLDSIPRFEEPFVLSGEATSLGQIGGSREGLSSMGFMMPTQYQPHEQSFGHFPSAYSSPNYIDQYSSPELHQTMAQTSSHGYAASYATSPPLEGSPSIPQRGGTAECDPKPNYQYSSAIRSPSYHGGTSSPAPQIAYSYTTAQGHPYVPAYSTPLDYAHTQYAQTYGGHYSSGYQQPHTPGAIAPQQHYGSPYDQHNPTYVDAAGVRVVNEPQRMSQCFEHGCAGRKFSTPSNLSRHRKEKNGESEKAVCPSCGTEFTRKTAMQNHLTQNKCKKRGSGRGIGSLPP